MDKLWAEMIRDSWKTLLVMLAVLVFCVVKCNNAVDELAAKYEAQQAEEPENTDRKDT